MVLGVISPSEKVIMLLGVKTRPSIWESSRWLWGKISLFLLSLMLHLLYHSILFPSHFLSKTEFPHFHFFPLPLWLSCLCYLTYFPFSHFSLTERQPSWCINCSAAAAQLLSTLLFVWRRPELLKAGALTKRRTNDRGRCQRNTQAFQRCKQMRACTKGCSKSLSRAFT